MKMRIAQTGAVNWYRVNIPAVADIQDPSYWPSKMARVTVPSLLIWTENERTFVPAMLDEIPKYVDDLTVTVTPGSGHIARLFTCYIQLGLRVQTN
jgi:pimeloyl-ACP methyl ester carboxylesterase